jgi:alanine-glyoxylate transaminase/serine-glyoxylate transaminase/serine-pyruvate transaminase
MTIATPPRRLARGRLFFANPGPTNIPDSILHACAHPTVDFNDAGFLAVYDAAREGLKRVLKTKQHLFMYTGSGHAAWEASLANLLSPGDLVLMPETGHFSDSWTEMAEALGLRVQTVAADWRRGVELSALRDAFAADRGHAIKAVCVVHNETSTGMRLPVEEVRAALDATGHPALLLVDTISSLGSYDFRMDEWGVDAAVGGSQKGLMLPTGFSFTGVSAKAMAAHKQAKLPRHYFDWSVMQTRRQKSFIGTVPTTLFYGLQESLRLIEEEGLEQVFARHARLGEAVRRCVRHWSGNAGPQLFCENPERYSNSVTTVLMPSGHDAEAVRRIAMQRFNVSLGGGLSKLSGQVFRIGHLGDLNEPMILGTLASVEMALKLAGVPHAPGGVAVAMAWLAEQAA